MNSVQCVCGTRVEKGSEADLFVALRRHADELHAALGITDEQVRGLIQRAEKMAEWDGQVAQIAGEVTIQPLTPDRQQDFLDYFDRDAFVDNPGWASCYCYYYRFPGTQEEWNRRTSEDNRPAQAAAIASGEATGFLAYADGTVVAWCHAAPRGDLPLLDTGATEADGERIAAVVCFNVAPKYRRQGLAAKLLRAACDEFAERGFTIMEGYAPAEFKSTAQAYHGPLSMYLAAGFEAIREEGPYTVVRRRLRGSTAGTSPEVR